MASLKSWYTNAVTTTAKEKRRFFRHPIGVPLKLRISEKEQPLRPMTSDISLGGLNFSWPKRLSKGTLLDISIPVKEKTFDVRAMVVYSKEDPRSARYRTGVSFVDFPSAFKAKLAEEVLLILEYQKTISRELGHDISEEEAARKWVSEYAHHFGQA